MSTYLWRLLGLCLIVGWWASPVWAGAVGGTIESLGAGDKTVVIKVGKDERQETVTLEAAATITLDGKPASAKDLVPGRYGVFFTDDANRASRVSLRSTAPSTAAPTKPAEPKTTTKSPMPLKNAPSSTAARGKAPAAGEWPQIRGPNRDGISTETGLLKTWPSDGPKLVWEAQGLGEGYSSVSVANGLVLTMGNQGDAEGVIAVDFKTGKQVWGTPTGRAFRESRGDGPRAVPTIDGNAAYALGGNGDLVCLDLASGKIRWQVNILQSTSGNNIKWGISESVLVDGDRVICTPGAAQATMIALNKQTGKLIWSCGAASVRSPGYASAVVATIGGVRQYVQFTGDGLIGVKADDGTFLWQDNSAGNGTANCSAALVQGNFVFYASGYGTGCALLEIGQAGGRFAARQVYQNKSLINHHGGMVLIDGYVYGCDERSLVCLDAKTGQVAWQDRCVGKGSVIAADGMLYVRSEAGPMALVEVNPKAYVEKGRFDPPKGNRNTWPYPVVAGGRLLLRDQEKLLCYDVKAQ
ncbi:MAG: PQQ-like beta-propeller repeat protein [Planctomycetaceae bacterium]|nr:PQQ-like beta-propeller repeat protein [Planctomycetaceae bacterium]